MNDLAFNPLSTVVWIVCLVGCVILGSQKDRVVMGVLLGVFCSFIGLIIMLIVPSKSRY